MVVCAIGADEAKPFDVSAPKKVDGEAAIALVKEAARQGVEQFVMITSLGTTKFGWPASVLNLFWGVLYHKKLAEQVRTASISKHAKPPSTYEYIHQIYIKYTTISRKCKLVEFLYWPISFICAI